MSSVKNNVAGSLLLAHCSCWYETKSDYRHVLRMRLGFLWTDAPYLLTAFNISIITRVDRAIDLGFSASKISQSMPLNRSSWTRHWDWWVCNRCLTPVILVKSQEFPDPQVSDLGLQPSTGLLL